MIVAHRDEDFAFACRIRNQPSVDLGFELDGRGLAGNEDFFLFGTELDRASQLTDLRRLGLDRLALV